MVTMVMNDECKRVNGVAFFGIPKKFAETRNSYLPSKSKTY